MLIKHGTFEQNANNAKMKSAINRTSLLPDLIIFPCKQENKTT